MPPHVLSTSLLFAIVQPRSIVSIALNEHISTSLCTEQYSYTAA